MDPLLLALIITLCFVAVVAVLGLKNKRQHDTLKDLEKLKKKDSKNYLHFLYRIYMVTPILRRYFVKMKNRMRATYPADEISLNSKTTKKMSLFLLVSAGLLALIFAIGGNDIAYICVGALAVYILFTDMVNNSTKKMEKTLLEQLDTLISEVHTNYDDTHIPSLAVEDALDNLPYEIGLHANIINGIITSSNPDAEIENYLDVAPNKFLLLFATILETVEEHGDKLLRDGRSMFIKNLDYLKQELGNERVRLEKRQHAFMGKTYSVLIGLFLLKPIELWSRSNMPETAASYSGSFGTVALAIIMAATFICYEVINILKDDPDEEGRDDKIYKKIAALAGPKKYITAYIDHNYTRCQRQSDSLKATGNKNGLNVFIVKRCVYAIICFLIVLGLSFYSVGREKTEIIKDFETAYTSAIVPDEEYRQTMREASAYFKKEMRSGTTTEEYTAMISDEQFAPIYKDLMVQELTERTESYAATYFTWWMLLLSLLAGVVGFFVPLIMLQLKKTIMGMARDDEVARFRTLILILMHEDGMTLNKILEWMERFAHAFKPSITDCIFSLEQNEEKAILEMKEKEQGFAPFRRLCDNLLSVDKVGIEKAFDGLETDRDYYKDKRKEDNEKILKTTSMIASIVEFIPVAIVTVIYLVIPLITLFTNMYSEMDFGSYIQ